jgi:hypothetical protein
LGKKDENWRETEMEIERKMDGEREWMRVQVIDEQ